TDYGGEADRQRSGLACLLEQLGPGIPGCRFVTDPPRRLEFAIADEPTGMDHPLGDPLTVEVGDLLEELVVFERGRPAGPDGSLRLVVADRMSLPVGQSPASIVAIVVGHRYVSQGILSCRSARGMHPRSPGF